MLVVTSYSRRIANAMDIIVWDHLICSKTHKDIA